MKYGGSTLFLQLAEWSHLPIDQLNFLITQFICLGASFAYRRFLHPSKHSPETRLIVALSLGIFLSYFCFGLDVLHLVGLPLCCFLALELLPISISHIVCLFMSFIYLSGIHLYRQWTDYGAYVIDITGPLMIITQKVTSLAFSLHDGIAKKWEDLNEGQKRYAIRRKPTLLEFFGYVINFQTLHAGPMVFFVDYEEFIRGTNFHNTVNARGLYKPASGNSELKKTDSAANGAAPSSNSGYGAAAAAPPCGTPIDKEAEPSNWVEVASKVSTSLMFALGFLVFGQMFDIQWLKSDEFFNSSVFYRFGYIIAATTVARWKYYLAWILADAIANASGLGFGGFDEFGSPRWDLISNVDVYGVEAGVSFRELIESWNKGTNRWLRMCVYERMPKFRTLTTYVMSAFWHGFYPGYYLTFVGGALFTLASRAARRSIRPLFLDSKEKKYIYDWITTIAARCILAYITFAFVLLEWEPSVKVYKSFYFGMHVIGLLCVVGLPIVLPPPKTRIPDGKSKRKD